MSRPEIFGAIAGTPSPAIARYTPANYKLPQGSPDTTILALKTVLSVLRDFPGVFAAASEATKISQADKILLSGICLALKPRLDSIHTWIVQGQLAALASREPAGRLRGLFTFSRQSIL